MGSDDIEQGSNNLRKAHPQVKQIMGSYQVRRRVTLAGIGIALIGIVAVVTFVSMHMNGKSKQVSSLLVKR
jgi:flagellar biosynthesis/type III secretory pathway M-ring protein FliF/YscJ